MPHPRAHSMRLVREHRDADPGCVELAHPILELRRRERLALQNDRRNESVFDPVDTFVNGVLRR
jgi:hypothetical protein